MDDLYLLNDIIFKVVFGSSTSQPTLRALLNALLGLTGPERIVDLEILNPNLDKEYLLDKGVVLDVRARDGGRRLYNIEVQVAGHPAYAERAVYYLARLFSSQLERGEAYSRIARTIGISLCDFALFPELQDLHSTYRLYDRQHERELTDILEIHFIELAKFRRDKPHELRTPFEKWLHVLKFGGLYETGRGAVPEALKQEEGIEMALEGMRRARASEEVRELIEARRKAEHDYATRMEQAMEEGLARGLARGRELGLEQGRELGLEQGREAALRETARRLLAAGVDRSTVAETTGLPPEVVDGLDP